MIQFLVLFSQKFAFRFESFALAENLEIPLQAVVKHVPQLLALGGKVEGFEALLHVFDVDQAGDRVL